MNNLQLAEKAQGIAKNYKTLYIMGCFGAPMNAKNKKRYTTNHTYNRQPKRTEMILTASPDTFGFDCIGLVKGILWGWDGDLNATYGGAVYKSNGVPDTGANGTIKLCKEVSEDFSKIEVGEFVWLDGHCGIYIGNGLAVESTPKWDNKVQITAVGNIGEKAGYNTRVWTKHGKLPWVEYLKSEEKPVAEKPKKTFEQIVDEVLNGKWGNGEERKRLLTNAGYNYDEVQAEVNRITKSNNNNYAHLTHLVKAGDTLTAIAKKYNTTVDALVKLNNIPNPSRIYVGQKLRVK